MAELISVEVVFALPEKQVLKTLLVAPGSTVGDVLRKSNLVNEFPGLVLEDTQAGIWGRPVTRDKVVAEGDRVELYRPLEVNPREARRLKAGS
jgi:putative ubiquitin-RnfH superfamily antitoxin RatB of RatAB toxin-antitoxin module